MKNQLTEEQLNRLLPALSLLAEEISSRIPLNRSSLAEILVSVGLDREDWAFQELSIWAKPLEIARDGSAQVQNEALVAELRSRGIPEFPAILSIHMATNGLNEMAPSDVSSLTPPMKSKREDKGTFTDNKIKPAQVGTAMYVPSKKTDHIDKPSEGYHRLLPDHGWHNDLTWAQLPDWIKRDAKLIARLKHGEHVIGKRVIYKMVANKLIRRLRYRVPVA